MSGSGSCMVPIEIKDTDWKPGQWLTAVATTARASETLFSIRRPDHATRSQVDCSHNKLVAFNCMRWILDVVFRLGATGSRPSWGCPFRLTADVIGDLPLSGEQFQVLDAGNGWA